MKGKQKNIVSSSLESWQHLTLSLCVATDAATVASYSPSSSHIKYIVVLVDGCAVNFLISSYNGGNHFTTENLTQLDSTYLSCTHNFPLNILTLKAI